MVPPCTARVSASSNRVAEERRHIASTLQCPFALAIASLKSEAADLARPGNGDDDHELAEKLMSCGFLPMSCRFPQRRRARPESAVWLSNGS
jgi:hypothetical protein